MDFLMDGWMGEWVDIKVTVMQHVNNLCDQMVDVIGF